MTTMRGQKKAKPSEKQAGNLLKIKVRSWGAFFPNLIVSSSPSFFPHFPPGETKTKRPSGLDNNLGGQKMCNLCFKACKHPRILQCSHLFCLNCLLPFINPKNVLSCPKCQKEFPIPKVPCQNRSSLSSKHSFCLESMKVFVQSGHKLPRKKGN